MLFRYAPSAARAATRSPLATGVRLASTSAARPAAAPASRWSTAAATVALAGTGLYLAAAPKLHLEGRASYSERLSRLPRNNEEALKREPATESSPSAESTRKEYSERITVVTDAGDVDEINVEGNDAEAVEEVAEAVVDAELIALTAEAEAALADDDQSAAFDPRTGEINWDCPCLGGMAHGPCGEEFKLAFSCFVFSEAEPKGIDCVEKFQNMQTCFRKHPDVYAEEIADDEEASRAAAQEAEAEAAVKA